MKKRLIIIMVGLFAMIFPGVAFAENEMSAPVYFNGNLMEFKNPPIIY